MAGIFAAKEALAKALGVGIAADIREICVKHDANGAPYYSLSGEYARFAEERRISGFFLSITHERDMAAAVHKTTCYCSLENAPETDQS